MYVGDFTGVATLEYAPHPDRHADPGEVVWTWVPFEDDPAQGKDRPVLVIGHHGLYLLALMLTSKDHDRDADDEVRRRGGSGQEVARLALSLDIRRGARLTGHAGPSERR